MRKIPLGVAVALVLTSPNVLAVQVFGDAISIPAHGDKEHTNYNNIKTAIDNNSNILNEVSKKTTQLEVQQDTNTSNINKANTNASSALEVAKQAKGEVEAATNAAGAAKSAAAAADSKADTAQKAADRADSRAETAQNKAVEALGQANTNKNDILALGSRVTSNESKISDLQSSIGKGGQAYDMAVDNKAAIKQEVKDRIEGQKATLAESKAYTDSKYAQLSEVVERNRKESFAGIAAALAASQIPQVTQGSYFSLGAGVGSYQGQSAVAVGMSVRFSDNLVSKLTITGDTQQRTGLGAGFAVEW